MTATTSIIHDREIVISRLVNAPQALVFEVWTQPEHLANWWGPNGFTIATESSDFRVGGHWKFMMIGPDGKRYPNHIAYEEITPVTRLRYAVSGEDHPAHLNFSATITFEDAGGGQTKVTMTTRFLSKEAVEFVVREFGAKEGGEQTIGKLAAYVEQLNK